MPLATKNNAIIIKDGKLAENCNCCGEWYCCADKACLAKPSSVTLSIVAEDFYVQHSATDNFGAYQSSVCFFGSAINGTHTLTSITPSGGYSSAWQKTFPAAPSGCPPSVFTLMLSASSRIAFDFYYTFTGPVFYYASQSAVKSKGEMLCGMATSGDEQAYFRGTPLNAVTSWSACNELPFTHARGINLNANEFLIASRSFDEAYGTSSTAINQIAGSGVGSITVTLNQ